MHSAPYRDWTADSRAHHGRSHLCYLLENGRRAFHETADAPRNSLEELFPLLKLVFQFMQLMMLKFVGQFMMLMLSRVFKFVGQLMMLMLSRVFELVGQFVMFEFVQLLLKLVVFPFVVLKLSQSF